MQRFLSDDVKYIFVENYVKCLPLIQSLDHQNITMDDFIIKISEYFHNSSNILIETKDDYNYAIQKLWKTFYQTIAIKYTDKEIEFYSQFIPRWMIATTDVQVYEWFSSLASVNEGMLHLCLLQITAALENAFGNFYLMKQKHRPFLLKDLIQSVFLKSIFGKEKMELLNVLFGGPLSLNLRNLLWHGFLTNDELPKLYFSTVLFIILYFSNFIFENNLLECYNPPKLLDKTSEITQLKPYFKNLKLDPEKILLLLNCSSYIPSTTTFLFKFSMELFVNKRYGDCITLLLPRIESLLRCRYVYCNKCPDRILTAQSAEFYTTIDEVLDRTINNVGENMLQYHIGKHMMVLIMDIFTLPDGIRLRDHLSHGELNSFSIDETISSIIILLAVLLSHDSQNSNGEVLCNKNCPCHLSEVFNDMHNIVQSYHPLFHPLSFAKKNAINCLLNAPDFSIPLDYPQHLVQVIESLSAIISQYLHVFMSNNDIVEFIELIQAKQLDSLYRNHTNNVIVRQISTHVFSLNGNVKKHLANRKQLFNEKLLRSRQRKNFERFLLSLPIFAIAIELLSVFILTSIHDIDSFEYFSTRKLKLILQICENCVTFSSQNVNKWDESVTVMTKLSRLLPIS